jgi:hypothetical protein
MKLLKHTMLAAGIAVALIVIPTQTANAYWGGPGYAAWHNAYVYDPAYRWGSPEQRRYIRDLYLRGQGYADWRQSRRWTYGWW